MKHTLLLAGLVLLATSLHHASVAADQAPTVPKEQAAAAPKPRFNHNGQALSAGAKGFSGVMTGRLAAREQSKSRYGWFAVRVESAGPDKQSLLKDGASLAGTVAYVNLPPGEFFKERWQPVRKAIDIEQEVVVVVNYYPPDPRALFTADFFAVGREADVAAARAATADVRAKLASPPDGPIVPEEPHPMGPEFNSHGFAISSASQGFQGVLTGTLLAKDLRPKYFWFSMLVETAEPVDLSLVKDGTKLVGTTVYITRLPHSGMDLRWNRVLREINVGEKVSAYVTRNYGDPQVTFTADFHAVGREHELVKEVTEIDGMRVQLIPEANWFKGRITGTLVEKSDAGNGWFVVKVQEAQPATNSIVRDGALLAGKNVVVNLLPAPDSDQQGRTVLKELSAGAKVVAEVEHGVGKHYKVSYAKNIVAVP